MKKYNSALNYILFLFIIFNILEIFPMANGYCQGKGLERNYHVLFCSGNSIYKSNFYGEQNLVYQAPGDAFSVNGIDLSKDRNHILFIEYFFNDRPKSRLCIIDFNSKKKILKIYENLCFNPVYSPDEKKVLFISTNKDGKGSLFQYDLKSHETLILIEDIVRNDTRMSPSWSPDGNIVLFDSIDCKISYIELTDSNEAQILTNGEFSSWFGSDIVYRPKCSDNKFAVKKFYDRHIEKLLISQKAIIKGSIYSPLKFDRNNDLAVFYSYKESLFGKPITTIYIYSSKTDSIIHAFKIAKKTLNNPCIIFCE